MKGWGLVLLLVGIAGAVLVLNMDTSVASEYERLVAYYEPAAPTASGNVTAWVM